MSYDIEAALLNCMIGNAQAFIDGSAKVKPPMFTDVHAQEIFEAILKMAEEGEPLTGPLVKDKISDGSKRFYEDYIRWSDADKANYQIYIDKILDKEKIRVLSELSNEVKRESEKGTSTIDILSMVEEKIIEVSNETIGSEMASLEDVISEFTERLKKGKEQGVATTIPKLDELTNGFLPGQLVVIAGRPGMGKSAFAMQIAYYNSLYNQVPFGIMLLEMSKEELLERLIANVAGIESWKLRSGKLSDTDWIKFDKFQTQFKKAPFYFDDSGSLNISTLRAKAKRLKMKNPNLGGIVVDYLQLMDSPTPKNRVEEVSEISRGLKMLAKDLKIPIIAVSQLNRGVEQRENKRPLLSDLRESGSIEQDTDMVIFLYRDDYYTGDDKDDSLTEIILAKQRNGATAHIKSIFHKKFQKFSGIT